MFKTINPSFYKPTIATHLKSNSDRRNQWEIPQPKGENAVTVEVTDFACPVCGKFPYHKDGVDKVMLKCADVQARQRKDHEDVVFFWSSQEK
jgi:DNA topoisomerase-1